jgi:hypothetical protein
VEIPVGGGIAFALPARAKQAINVSKDKRLVLEQDFEMQNSTTGIKAKVFITKISFSYLLFATRLRLPKQDVDYMVCILIILFYAVPCQILMSA